MKDRIIKLINSEENLSHFPSISNLSNKGEIQQYIDSFLKTHHNNLNLNAYDRSFIDTDMEELKTHIISRRTELLKKVISNDHEVSHFLPDLAPDADGSRVRSYLNELNNKNNALTPDGIKAFGWLNLPDTETGKLRDHIIAHRQQLIIKAIKDGIDKDTELNNFRKFDEDSAAVRKQINKLAKHNKQIPKVDEYSLPNDKTHEIYDHLQKRRKELIKAEIENDDDLSHFPDLGDNKQPKVVREHFNKLRHGKTPIDKIILPDSETPEVRNLLIARRKELLGTKVSLIKNEVTKDKDIAHFDELDPAADANKVRAYINANKFSDHHPDIKAPLDEMTLPDEETDAIRDHIVAHRKFLYILQAIKNHDVLNDFVTLDSNVDDKTYVDALRLKIPSILNDTYSLDSYSEDQIKEIKQIINERRIKLVDDSYNNLFNPLKDNSPKLHALIEKNGEKVKAAIESLAVNPNPHEPKDLVDLVHYLRDAVSVNDLKEILKYFGIKNVEDQTLKEIIEENKLLHKKNVEEEATVVEPAELKKLNKMKKNLGNLLGRLDYFLKYTNEEKQAENPDLETITKIDEVTHQIKMQLLMLNKFLADNPSEENNKVSDRLKDYLDVSTEDEKKGTIQLIEENVAETRKLGKGSEKRVGYFTTSSTQEEAKVVANREAALQGINDYFNTSQNTDKTPRTIVITESRKGSDPKVTTKDTEAAPARWIPMEVRIPESKAVVRTAILQTQQKDGGAMSELRFCPGDLKKFKESRAITLEGVFEGLFSKPTSIPGMARMEVIANFANNHHIKKKNPSGLDIIDTSKMSPEWAKGLCLYYDYKGWGYTVTQGSYKVTLTQAEKDLFAKKWLEIHPNDLGIKQQTKALTEKTTYRSVPLR